MPPSRIAKNTAYLTMAFTAQKILSFAYFAFIARFIGNDDSGIGKYVFALSFTAIFGMFIDFGMHPVLIREIARDKSKIAAFLSTILTSKIIFGFLAYIVAVGVINFSGKDSLTQELVVLTGIIMILDSFSLSLFGAFRGVQNLRYEALATIIGKVIAIVVGVISLYLGFGIHMLIGAVLCSSIFIFLYALYNVIRKLHIVPKIYFDAKLFKQIMKLALPFGIAGLLVNFYGYFDTVLLSFLAGDRYVGWYSVANKLTNALQFIPSAFVAALFPAMSAYFLSSKEMLARTFERAMFYLMIIAVPISVGSILLAEPIIMKVYGPVFEASIPALKILMLGLPFLFLNFPVGYLLNASNKQTINTINIAITLAASIVLNIFLIQKWNFIGASIANLCTTVLLFSLGLRQVGMVIDYQKRLLLKVLGKVLVSAGVMALFILLWKNAGLTRPIELISLIVISGLVYGGALLLLGGLNKEDLNKIYQAVAKRVAA